MDIIALDPCLNNTCTCILTEQYHTKYEHRCVLYRLIIKAIGTYNLWFGNKYLRFSKLTGRKAENILGGFTLIVNIVNMHVYMYIRLSHGTKHRHTLMILTDCLGKA